MNSIQQRFAMKSFRNVFGLPIKVAALAMCSWGSAQAQVPLNDYYQHTYRIGDQEQPSLFWETEGISHNVHSGSWSGLPKQTWMIMPLGPGSDEYAIASLDDGGVLEKHISRNIYVNTNGFQAGSNQIFKFRPAATSPYQIIAPLTDWPWGALDRCKSSRHRDPFSHPDQNAANIYANSDAGVNNQHWFIEPVTGLPQGFTSYLPRSNTAIRQPAPPSDLSGFDIAMEANETIMDETVVPFVFVKNDLSPWEQVTETPYYKVRRSQYWKLRGSFSAAPGFEEISTLQAANGITASSSYEVANKLDISFTASGALAFVLGHVGAKLATVLGVAFSRETQEVDTLTESFSTVRTNTIDIAVSCPTVFAYYQRMDRFALIRSNGTQVGDTWDVGYDISDPTSKSIVYFRDCGAAGGRLGDLQITELGESADDIETLIED